MGARGLPLSQGGRCPGVWAMPPWGIAAAGGGRGEGEGLSSHSRAWKQVLQDHPRADGWERGDPEG